MCTPNGVRASSTAEMIAAGAGTTPHSPTPFTPSGFSGEGDSWWMISTGGISVSHRRRQLLDRLKIQLKYLDAAEWRCWAGMAKTLALFVVPRKVVSVLKAEWRSWPDSSPGVGDAVNHAGLPRGVTKIARRSPKGDW